MVLFPIILVLPLYYDEDLFGLLMPLHSLLRCILFFYFAIIFMPFFSFEKSIGTQRNWFYLCVWVCILVSSIASSRRTPFFIYFLESIHLNFFPWERLTNWCWVNLTVFFLHFLGLLCYELFFFIYVLGRKCYPFLLQNVIPLCFEKAHSLYILN